MAWPLIAQDPDDYLEAIEPRPIKTHDTMLWYFARPGLKVRCYVEAGEEERAIEWAESQLGPV